MLNRSSLRSEACARHFVVIESYRSNLGSNGFGARAAISAVAAAITAIGASATVAAAITTIAASASVAATIIAIARRAGRSAGFWVGRVERLIESLGCQVNTALTVDLRDAHSDGIAKFDHILRLVDTLVAIGELRHMDETVLAGKNFHKCAELQEANDSTVKLIAGF